MEDEELVRIDLICTTYEIEPSFIDSLFDFGLIEITTVEEDRFLNKQKISDLEKWIHLHYELEINLEGIDTIAHLLDRVSALQDELISLKNRLQFYESFRT